MHFFNPPERNSLGVSRLFQVSPLLEYRGRSAYGSDSVAVGACALPLRRMKRGTITAHLEHLTYVAAQLTMSLFPTPTWSIET